MLEHHKWNSIHSCWTWTNKTTSMSECHKRYVIRWEMLNVAVLNYRAWRSDNGLRVYDIEQPGTSAGWHWSEKVVSPTQQSLCWDNWLQLLYLSDCNWQLQSDRYLWQITTHNMNPSHMLLGQSKKRQRPSLPNPSTIPSQVNIAKPSGLQELFVNDNWGMSRQGCTRVWHGGITVCS